MSTRLSLFADCLLAGLLVLALALPVVTAYPGFVAACSFPFSFRGYVVRLREAVRSGAAGMLVPPLAVGIVLLDAVAIQAGLPGSVVFGPLVAVAGVVLAVLGLRAAARWRPGVLWSAVVREAWRDLTGDVRGSLLLGLAVVAAVGVALLVPITLLLLGGVLALAATAVGSRVEVAS
ncbi:MAG TPA: hypothetical protein VFC19_46815 [Candidatus Limnocylindrales bacterium]|nr:hypothetical protein [Candidatus Limnocylindrales bacterium]